MIRRAHSWADVARLRQGFHRFFSQAFMPPDAGRLEGMKAGAEVLTGWGLDSFSFGVQWQKVFEKLEESPSLDDIESAYVRLFDVWTSGTTSPPLESFYVDGPPGTSALVASKLREDYRAMGLGLAPMACCPPDHVATEFEVLASLCEREYFAWVDQRPDEVARMLELQRDFLWRHLGVWFPIFVSNVELQTSGTFYAAVVEAALAFVHHDRELVKLLSRAELGRMAG